MTHGKTVLMLGLDPEVVDYASLPTKLDEPSLRAGLAADEKRLQDLGYDAKWLLIDRGETAEAVVTAALAEKTYACVLIGAGIRTIPPLFSLFEKLVNGFGLSTSQGVPAALLKAGEVERAFWLEVRRAVDRDAASP